jgi:DNA polymerase IV
VGPKTAGRLRAVGVETIGDLQRASELELAERLSERAARELKARAFFYDDSPVKTSRVAKSRSHETTFDTDVADLEQLEATAVRLAD